MFSHLFRSEFVKSYKEPLCSDAFTSWNGDDDENIRETHNREVSAATEHLYKNVIPAFAANLDRIDTTSIEGPFKSKEAIKHALTHFSHGQIHGRGINFRHLVN